MKSRSFLCSSSLATIVAMSAFLSADDWPQWRGVHRDGKWHETGLLKKFNSNQIPIQWRQPIGSGYSGPTVADGRVFVTDRIVEPSQQERIHCFNSQTGEPLWSHTYPCLYDGIGYQAGPRASVTIDGSRAYALGAAGSLHCLDVRTGEVIWSLDLDKTYRIRGDGEKNRMPMWGIAAAPLVHQGVLILHVGGSNGACVVGLDKSTGEEMWHALNDRAQYSSPILVNQAGQVVAVVWTGDSVAALDPQTGSVHWRVPLTPSRMPIGVATPIVQQDRLFVTSFYDGSLMLRLESDRLAASPLWRTVGPDEQHTEALHSIISTPIALGEHIYGVDSYGELRCLEAATGRRIWEDRTATPRSRWSTIHFVDNGDRVWMFNERGELIIARLSPSGFEEVSRAQLIRPTLEQLRRRGGVCWAHPAFAGGHVFARNDEELVCADLRKPE